jgi:hypothetical protein
VEHQLIATDGLSHLRRCLLGQVPPPTIRNRGDNPRVGPTAPGARFGALPASVKASERPDVSPSRNGKPWREDDDCNWGRRAFSTAAKSAKLDNLNPYALRHTCASLFAAAG